MGIVWKQWLIKGAKGVNPFERVKHSRVAIEGVSHHEWALCCEITFFPLKFSLNGDQFCCQKIILQMEEFEN